MSKNTVLIKDLYDHFNRSFGPDSTNFLYLTSEVQTIVDACLNCLLQGVHPIFVLHHSALQTLINETSFNFFDFDCPDAKTSFSLDSSQEDKESLKSKIELVLSEQSFFVSCKFFSYSENTCKDYAYANVVKSPTCSSSSVESHSCSHVLAQAVCPFYQADQELFTKHFFTNEDKEYFYTSYITRYKDGTRLIHIFNQEEDLLTQLSYSLEDFNKIDISSLKNEISDIVTEIYQNSFLKQNTQTSFQDSFEHSQNPEESQSYILSLIN